LVLKAEGEAGEAWENFQKAMLFRKTGYCHLGFVGLIKQRYDRILLGCLLVNKG
jgi:hypothetical protein